MDCWPNDATVPSFGPRMGCSHCGKLGATAMPNRIERADRLPGGALMLVRAAIPRKLPLAIRQPRYG
jgi:hypothetical protein